MWETDSYNPANIAKHILVEKHVGEVKQDKNKKINAKLMKLKLSTNKFVKITKSTVVWIGDRKYQFNKNILRSSLGAFVCLIYKSSLFYFFHASFF